jgi:hypothetical protein
MHCDLPVFSLMARRNFKWLWLLVPVATVLSSFRSFLVLQLLSAMVLFTLLFVILVFLAALFVFLLLAADCILDWMVLALASIGRSFQSLIRDMGKLPVRAPSFSQLSGGRGRRS